MNVNEKGVLGQIKVVEDLYSKGYNCFLPFDDYSPIDLIAVDSEGYCNRIQIKTRSKNSNDKYEIHFSSVVNGKRVLSNLKLIDYYAIYLVELDKIVYIAMEDFKGRKSFSFREADLISNKIILKELY